MIEISVAKDFTKFPSGRYRKNGKTSGEEFRERFLEPPLRKGEDITVDLDGVIGYGSSFLEEAFGGLIRSLKRAPSDILQHMDIQTSDKSLIDEIHDYMNDAGRRLAND